uniref:T-box domain-containing protein n=1 Tax=Caenorhabditis japonica TaxID=281687 RepID=A0A8R1EH80_CAEJA
MITDSQPIVVSLAQHHDALWRQFNGHHNEMIVTKGGRKMFPKLEYVVRGLHPDKLYAMTLRLELADESRFKFSGGEWMKSGKAEQHQVAKTVWHADGVLKGRLVVKF